MSSTGKRFRTSTACTTCRQLKMKCDRRERQPNRCSRCESMDQPCELSSVFQRRRMKGQAHNEEETRRLREELEQLKSQVSSLLPLLSPHSLPATGPSIVAAPTIFEPNVSRETIQRSAEGITLLPDQIDAAFKTFFRDMHPYFPFLDEVKPDSCYNREPFLFWAICMLGLRSTYPALSNGLSNHVTMESIQAPLRSCHNQNAATTVVQGLLLLSIWPMSTPSLLHEASWLHCGSATHLALHLGLHQPYSASEFVPESGRDHIPNHFVEFRRTWIAVYICNSIISFVRGYPCTVKADYNIIEYALSSPEKLSISPDLFKTLLIARRIEEGQDLGHSRTSPHGHIDPDSREGIYRLLQARISDTEKRASPLTPFLSMIFMAAKLQPAIQETTVLSACDDAAKVNSLTRVVQSQANMVHLPVFVDSFVLMSAVLIFKIHISIFSPLINDQMAQDKISEACSYFREGVNEFSDIPARVSIFVEALYTLVAENLVPVGGFVIENTKSRYSQNILYEVLWTFKEWKRQRIEALRAQQQPLHFPAEGNLIDQNNHMLPFLGDEQLDHSFWDMLEVL
ncbi:hypothetical protein L207DRAFT_574030 [Hyaloscypha variabilis F]|uniref:Zn(2)-C6 fungal-type domain-containing protein n=1 Tax=Hyaloscypha variabilis (strain UAMH 11265 / GT02V1 / F) TaxID=1149755 RepID=A0A2J6QTR7_HYAVF|nr:hypothetical protein L207DRAFT_574030 [Hyaloscypha variabilis F]